MEKKSCRGRLKEEGNKMGANWTGRKRDKRRSGGLSRKGGFSAFFGEKKNAWRPAGARGGGSGPVVIKKFSKSRAVGKHRKV